MMIIYHDGSTLECETIEVCGKDLFCDEYRIVPIDEIDHIES